MLILLTINSFGQKPDTLLLNYNLKKLKNNILVSSSKNLTEPVKSSNKIGLYDSKDSLYYQMNFYSKNLLSNPNEKESEDFNYNWYTTYDNDSTIKYLLQTMQFYFYKDSSVVLRQLLYNRKLFKNINNLTENQKSIDKKKKLRDSTIFNASKDLGIKSIIKGNRLKIGRYYVVKESNNNLVLKMDLYTPKTKNLWNKINFFLKSKHAKETIYKKWLLENNEKDPLTIYLTATPFPKRKDLKNEILNSKNSDSITKKTEDDSTLSNNNNFIKKIEEDPNSTFFTKTVSSDSFNITSNLLRSEEPNIHFMNRLQIELIEYEASNSTNGIKKLKIKPDKIFELGRIRNNKQAEFYFRLVRYLKP
jgi:hypothetical protein